MKDTLYWNDVDAAEREAQRSELISEEQSLDACCPFEDDPVIPVKREHPCPSCNGIGLHPYKGGSCPYCYGTGDTELAKQIEKNLATDGDFPDDEEGKEEPTLMQGIDRNGRLYIIDLRDYEIVSYHGILTAEALR